MTNGKLHSRRGPRPNFEGDGSGTHPNILVTFARCERDLTQCYTNSEREDGKERADVEGHLAKDDGGNGEEEEGKEQTVSSMTHWLIGSLRASIERYVLYALTFVPREVIRRHLKWDILHQQAPGQARSGGDLWVSKLMIKKISRTHRGRCYRI